jgi:hypothetical protein
MVIAIARHFTSAGEGRVVDRFTARLDADPASAGPWKVVYYLTRYPRFREFNGCSLDGRQRRLECRVHGLKSGP